jgi:hypothetical protein
VAGSWRCLTATPSCERPMLMVQFSATPPPQQWQAEVTLSGVPCSLGEGKGGAALRCSTGVYTGLRHGPCLRVHWVVHR